MFLENVFIGLIKLVIILAALTVVGLVLLGFAALWSAIPIVGPVLVIIAGIFALAWVLGACEEW